jgi:NADP-dependent 3-hydroxy acid dehydrogenase YdfG
MAKFEDQVAVVTGASAGIGMAISKALAAEGASVCLIGRNSASLETAAGEIGGRASSVKTYRTDLTADADIHSLKACLSADFGHVDILIHSAGIYSMGRIEDSPVEQFDIQYRTNVRAPYLLTQALLPMIRSRKGQIVFINSSAGLNSKANVSQYSATKHGLKAVADSLREEVNEEGIRVLSIYPGRTATAMQARVHEMEGKEYFPDFFLQPADIAEVIITALSLPRGAEVTDIQIRPLVKHEQ